MLQYSAALGGKLQAHGGGTRMPSTLVGGGGGGCTRARRGNPCLECCRQPLFAGLTSCPVPALQLDVAGNAA